MTDNHINKDALDQVLKLGGIALLARLIEMFQSTILERLDAADEALRDNRLSDLHRELHSMRSSAGNLGADILSAACQEVELAIRNNKVLNWEEKLTTIRELHRLAHLELVEFCATYDQAP